MLHFAYGANLCKAHMTLWCPGNRPLRPAALPDHRLVFRFWADILPSPGDAVLGALYDVPKGDLRSLDEFEDCPTLYDRINVVVEADGGPVRAFAYRMRPGYAFAPPSPDYVRLVRQGYKDWDLHPDALPVKA